MVTNRDRGSTQRQRLRSIQEAARNSIGCEVGKALEFEAKMLVTKLIETRESIAEVDSKIAEVSRELPGYKSIINIPGIGPAVAAVVLASLGDPFRFSSAK